MRPASCDGKLFWSAAAERSGDAALDKAVDLSIEQRA
jgi:hypothetical protein